MGNLNIEKMDFNDHDSIRNLITLLLNVIESQSKNIEELREFFDARVAERLRNRLQSDLFRFESGLWLIPTDTELYIQMKSPPLMSIT